MGLIVPKSWDYRRKIKIFGVLIMENQALPLIAPVFLFFKSAWLTPLKTNRSVIKYEGLKLIECLK